MPPPFRGESGCLSFAFYPRPRSLGQVQVALLVRRHLKNLSNFFPPMSSDRIEQMKAREERGERGPNYEHAYQNSPGGSLSLLLDGCWEGLSPPPTGSYDMVCSDSIRMTHTWKMKNRNFWPFYIKVFVPYRDSSVLKFDSFLQY